MKKELTFGWVLFFKHILHVMMEYEDIGRYRNTLVIL